jgi:16S rRNA (guanine(966)-N(2))-methyltransferase RsmD
VGRVRIIGGQWRSRVLTVAPVAALRPTADRVRETLFNWLGQDLTGLTCLDLFAGSGALGFEAASRGAANVVMVERDAAAFQALAANARALDAARVELRREDGLQFLRRDSRCFDVVFLDPPYAGGELSQALSILSGRIAPGGRVYAESARDVTPGNRWEIVRSGRAGRAHYALLAPLPESVES